ncbi:MULTISPECIES: 2-succinyl-5-enolpyruvyl-6-hydroxy-3-cyclohexene-1-carboxylic-acid synthase [Flavobacterium]|uniref:2-succinyl-5-enolpyruvyl-6-hydroxy-3-cyclohexene-1-carboxylate synthase n=3 Tax=Flavobacterium TaxID=237 RepID=A0AA94F4D0_9FLAO|nr:2-succinyl-5-enolpyruvyl-6-hydroxy-3-cyclohexene-1-carboxylic-acid synthase [Flavobacterium columnare]MCH4830491.1 2-succinyl-5-enolpyruvyl-6-hydroxy-3-cyclohexene-1-carboxylic-acid synthase [Flavobacterium columnare]MCH4833572.1 2-succinyl-5-enolpyruvyl-6-hydroxy-3-cyclohexene-1-carboxylic-acid synthase [Flavobacterium columnare]OXA75098.1 2-succinyl-5-enolpyruvyl-6-hydroxy-3-cyclohexene-1-carboxylic-acid synthase [Flavobacterium columnare NBRC 100251 = ATCC 23463]
MKPTAIYPKIPLAQSIIEMCKKKGLKHIVISPGSRNAPLTIGFSNQAEFNCYSIVDERCAGFFALGLAQQLQEPVALICTSGSALLNYYPAISEAFYSQIPLVVISADRPIDKIDIGDGQTIRQANVFANHILYNANLQEAASLENDRLIQEALFFSVSQKGPVHINAPFEEPLYETISEPTIEPTWFNFEKQNEPLETLDFFAEEWSQAQKKIILIGENHSDSIDTKYLDILARDPSVIVMTEVTSNLHHENFITNIDTIITPFSEKEFERYKPEILLTLGGMIVSKRIKAFFRKYQPNAHWHIDPLRAYNTYDCLNYHFKEKPNTFFERFLKLTSYKESSFQKELLAIRFQRKIAHNNYLKELIFSDLKVFQIITELLPKNIQLQISNSSAIRYAQLFPIDPSISVYCNRGTSGIEGSTTTAIGAAVASKKTTYLITGDISFFYDSNALWNHYIPNDFKIIIINNGGGGIFRILPGHQENETFNTFFETSHNLTAEYLAKMYGLDYFKAKEEKELRTNWAFFSSLNKPAIYEIFTPEKQNNEVLLQYFKKLK